MPPLLSRRQALLATALACTSWPTAQAQDYPAKPIQLIVPFHPNGSTTVVMRHLAPLLSARLGQQVVVINKPGGGGSIGMAQVAQAAPDGHTLGVLTLGIVAQAGLQMGRQPYHVQSFAPVGLVARTPLVLTVNPALGIHSLQELLERARAQPGALNYGSAGIGSSGHLGMALLESAAQIRMTHIPFNTVGSGTSVASGEVQLQLGPIPSSLPLIQGGRMRPLGVSGQQPVAALPGGQPLSTQGLPGFEAYDWSGIVAPSGTAPAIVHKLALVLEQALQDAALRSRIAQSGAEVLGSGSAHFATFLAQEMQTWTRLAPRLQAAAP